MNSQLLLNKVRVSVSEVPCINQLSCRASTVKAGATRNPWPPLSLPRSKLCRGRSRPSLTSGGSGFPRGRMADPPRGGNDGLGLLTLSTNFDSKTQGTQKTKIPPESLGVKRFVKLLYFAIIAKFFLSFKRRQSRLFKHDPCQKCAICVIHVCPEKRTLRSFAGILSGGLRGRFRLVGRRGLIAGKS